MSALSDPASKSSNPRPQALLGHEFFAPQQWKRRLLLWFGAVLVALATILFAKASTWTEKVRLETEALQHARNTSAFDEPAAPIDDMHDDPSRKP